VEVALIRKGGEETMNNMKRVLEEYRRGDSHTRLHLFLECRAFRKAFMTIEQEEASVEVPALDEGGRAGQERSTRRWTRKRVEGKPRGMGVRACSSVGLPCPLGFSTKSNPSRNDP
jgi:hypothetical protein